MSYRMIFTLRRLMCDKFSVLCTRAELNAKQEREDTKLTNDKLTEMFEMQAGLDGRIIKERGIEKSMSEWVVGITIAMESEIDEIRREVNWKWWKNPKAIDEAALQRSYRYVPLPAFIVKGGRVNTGKHSSFIYGKERRESRKAGRKQH